MKKTLLFFLIILFLALPAMAYQNLSASSIDATTPSLKGIYTLGKTGSYAALTTGDICFVFNYSTRDLTMYFYDSTSAAVDDGDIYVTPSWTSSGNAYSGDARWIKMGLNTMGTTMSATANPTIYFNSTATDWWHGVDDSGGSFEWRLNSSIGTNVLMELDESGNLVLTGAIHGGVEIISDDTSLSAAQCYGSFDKCNGTETITLPAALTGMNVIIYSDDATVKTVDPDGTDHIWLNGVDNGAGNSIDSPGAVGDFITLICISSGNWYTAGRSGTWIDSP